MQVGQTWLIVARCDSLSDQFTDFNNRAMHFQGKDVVVVFLEDGDLKSTTLVGQDTVAAYTSGTVRFNTPNRTHSEMLVRGIQRAIITKLK